LVLSRHLIPQPLRFRLNSPRLGLRCRNPRLDCTRLSFPSDPSCFINSLLRRLLLCRSLLGTLGF
jgi:hypothetical protein